MGDHKVQALNLFSNLELGPILKHAQRSYLIEVLIGIIMKKKMFGFRNILPPTNEMKIIGMYMNCRINVLKHVK